MRDHLPRGVIYYPPARVVSATSMDPKPLVTEARSVRWAERHRNQIDVVLVREDRWTLGASLDDALAAFSTWSDSWLFFAYRAPEGWPLGRMIDFEGTIRVLLDARQAATAAQPEVD